MKSVKREDGWWVTEIPECGDCGPYQTKADADDTKNGLQRTFDHMDDWSFWTCEPKPKQKKQTEPEPEPESPVKKRKQRSDKGKPRGPRKPKPETNDGCTMDSGI